MSEVVLLNTMADAAVSSASRGAISAIDRLQFGVRKKKITFTNIHNNIAALLVGIVAAALFGKLSGITQQLFEVRVFIFAGLLQLSANAFSYAFRHMRVSSLIVVTKVSDIFIAPLVFLLFSKWSSGDFAFAMLTSLGCLAVLLNGGRVHLHLKSAVFVCLRLIAQGGLSPWYMAEVTEHHDLWVPFTCALITWRLLFSLAFSFRGLPSVPQSFFGHDLEYWVLHVIRAGLTLSAQVFQVLALSYGRPIVAWPILNATGLFAILFSYLILKERATRQETFAIVLISMVGVIRMLI